MLAFASCGPDLRLKHIFAGQKYRIVSTTTRPIGDGAVQYSQHDAEWQTGHGNWQSLVIFDVENTSDEPRCAAVYFVIDSGYSLDRWGDGEPIIVAPHTRETQVAGFLSTNEIEYRHGAAAELLEDGQCPELERPPEE